MRIAHFAWESLHSIAVGGVANHVTELAAGLQRRGHEVHVFTRLGEGQTTYDRVHGVHYHRCPIPLDPDFITEMNNMGNRFVYFLRQTEAYQGAHFDVVHGHDWLCAKAVVQARNDFGRRTVLSFHATEFGRCGNVNYDGQSERIRAIEAEGAGSANRVVTVSGALAEEVKAQYGVPDSKLRTVFNGINCGRFDGAIDPGICRRTYGIGPLDPMVLYVGRLSYQKGPDLLMESVPGVLHQRPDAKVVLVGDGHLRGQLERRAEELGVAHAVRFLGAMAPYSDLENLFRSADVVAVPSRNEPFGIVILEAWAAGKPVVVTHNGGPKEFVSHDLDGYVVYDSPPSICWGITQVFGDFDHARWMGERGRVKAAFNFSWDRIAGQVEGIYGELV